MQYDRNGVLVRQSQPVKELRTTKKVITIDSRDRDPTKFVKVNGGSTVSDPGDYVVYLPRVYENVVSLRLKSATIQAPTSGLGFNPTDLYVLMSLENLNRSDETASGADRAGFVDSWFAKIPVDTGAPLSGSTITNVLGTAGVVTITTAIPHGLFVGQTVNINGTVTSGGATFSILNTQVATVPSTTTFTVANAYTVSTSAATGTVLIPGVLFYNDNSYDEQIIHYTPAIGRLDRFHVTLRRHQPFSAITITSPMNAPITFGSGENSFTFEIEYLDNGFDQFSSFETQMRRY
jgi:hypothetical protein